MPSWLAVLSMMSPVDCTLRHQLPLQSSSALVPTSPLILLRWCSVNPRMHCIALSVTSRHALSNDGTPPHPPHCPLGIVEFIRYHMPSGHTVEVMCSGTSTPIAPLASFHSTIVMNFHLAAGRVRCLPCDLFRPRIRSCYAYCGRGGCGNATEVRLPRLCIYRLTNLICTLCARYL